MTLPSGTVASYSYWVGAHGETGVLGLQGGIVHAETGVILHGDGLGLRPLADGQQDAVALLDALTGGGVLLMT